MRYHNLSTRKRNGVVYTPPELAQFVAQQILRYSSVMLHPNILTAQSLQASSQSTELVSNQRLLSILDPAVGGGELLLALAQQLLAQGITQLKLVGYDTDAQVAQATQEQLSKSFPQLEVEIRVGDFLEQVEAGQVEKFDLVIANPPYVRTQVLGTARAQELSHKLQLTGRVDLYYLFLLYAREVLKPQGIAGFITSNKFLTVKAGQAVRQFISENYELKHIFDLGDTQLFEAAVLPCVMVFGLGNTPNAEQIKFTSVYSLPSSSHLHISDEESVEQVVSVAEPTSWLEFLETYEGIVHLAQGKRLQMQQGRLGSLDPEQPWCVFTACDKQFLARVAQHQVQTFATLGKIRVGIKTTADNVFIGNDWEQRGHGIELLRPLLTHRSAGQIVAKREAQPWQVLYPHACVDGKTAAVNIIDYPNSHAYLVQHFKQLDGRNYVKQAKRQWFEIWVPQNPVAWSKGKIVFRDIAEQREFWWDDTGAVVNGDCYWIAIHPEMSRELVYLALAVANSKFIEKYYDIKFNNKIYGNKRRFQSQYVEQFPLPSLESVYAQEAIQLVQNIITTQTLILDDKQRLDELVLQMFGVNDLP